jgi:hypothetical protein
MRAHAADRRLQWTGASSAALCIAIECQGRLGSPRRVLGLLPGGPRARVWRPNAAARAAARPPMLRAKGVREMGVSYYDTLLPVREPGAGLRSVVAGLRLPYRVLASICVPAGRIVLAFVSDSARRCPRRRPPLRVASVSPATANRRTSPIAARSSQLARDSSRCVLSGVRSRTCSEIVHPFRFGSSLIHRRHVLARLQKRLDPSETRPQTIQQVSPLPPGRPGTYRGSSSRLRFCCSHIRIIARRLPHVELGFPARSAAGHNPKYGCRTGGLVFA